MMSLDKTWDLRSGIYDTLHRWYWLAAMFAIGAAIGWLASFVWPSYTRSVQTIYVGLNPYRAFSDSNFLALSRPKYSNVDNYHYWQMSELEAFIFSQAVLEATLDELKRADPAWASENPESLRLMLETEWQTAGDWDLIATDRNPERSRQAVETWSQVVIRDVEKAVSASQDTFMLDQQLEAAARELSRLSLRKATLESALSSSTALRDRLAELPADQSLEPSLRWQTAGLIAAAAGSGSAWDGLLARQPQESTLPGEAAAWLDEVAAQINVEAGLIPGQIQAMQNQQAGLQDTYRQANAASWSLSPNLAIEGLGETRSETVRPSSLLALIGGFVGLLGSVVYELVRLSRGGHGVI